MKFFRQFCASGGDWRLRMPTGLAFALHRGEPSGPLAFQWQGATITDVKRNGSNLQGRNTMRKPSENFLDQIPVTAFINAQVIQEALRNGNLLGVLRATAKQQNLPDGLREWPLVNPGYVASLLYCLIVVPKEVWDPPSNDAIYKLLDKHEPIRLFQIKKWRPPDDEHPIRDFIRHLRNAIAHVRFVVDSDRSFEFWDMSQKDKPDSENFRVFVSLNNLARFLSSVGRELANLRNR